jgi:hypothetical protein
MEKQRNNEKISISPESFQHFSAKLPARLCLLIYLLPSNGLTQKKAERSRQSIFVGLSFIYLHFRLPTDVSKRNSFSSRRRELLNFSLGGTSGSLSGLENVFNSKYLKI